jgi:hypothetical protein
VLHVMSKSLLGLGSLKSSRSRTSYASLRRFFPEAARPRCGRLHGPRWRFGGQRCDGELFALLQKSVLNRQRCATRDGLRLAVITWIEGTYSGRRLQRVLGRLTPSSSRPSTGPKFAQAA